MVLKSKVEKYDEAAISGMDKSQLLQLVKETVESEEEVAEILALATAKENEAEAKNGYDQKEAKSRNDNDLRNHVQKQANQLGSMTPEQLRSQAQMMKTMDSATIRRMNPAMKNFTDAQIQMAANEMEMMAANPQMFKNMVNQMNNMGEAELEQVRRMKNGGAPGPGNAAPRAAGDISKQQIESGMQNMANLPPEKLRQQVDMMKSMDPATLRRMNPAMANWGDAQIQMAISQMDMMASNPDMMKTVSEQMKNMSPDDIRKMQAEAMSGPGSAGNVAAPGMPQDPMQMLQNADPAQIKQMMKMVKDNPKLMKDMLRSANPAMADKISDEQISKTVEMFAGMDEKKIEKLMKFGGYAQKASQYVKGKGMYIIISMAIFCYAVIAYVIKSRVKDPASTMDASSFVQPEPVPVIPDEDEFASVEL